MDYAAAEKHLRNLLALSPSHNAGTLQLARLLSEVHFSRANIAVTPEMEEVMDQICTLFEKSIAATKDVRKNNKKLSDVTKTISCFINAVIFWVFCTSSLPTL